LRLQHPPPTELYPLSLHDALPICRARSGLPPPPGTQQHPVIVVPPLTLGRTNYPVTQAIPLKVEPANRHRAIGNDFWVLGDSSRLLRSRRHPAPARTTDPEPAFSIERGEVMSIFSHFQQRFEATRQEEYSLQEYLELCKQDRSAYATAAERLLMAI